MKNHILYIFYAVTCITGIFALVLGLQEDVIAQLIQICTMPTRVYTSYFMDVGIGGAFLNSFLVQLVLCIMFTLSKRKLGGLAYMAYVLTLGFTFWGVNICNMWFGMLGVLLYCLLQRKHIRNHVPEMLFTTGMAPMFTDLLFHYPLFQDNLMLGLLCSVVVGIGAGYVLPAMLKYGKDVHHGYSLYNAGWAVMLCTVVCYAFFYRFLLQQQVSVNQFGLEVNARFISNLYCLCIFGVMVIYGIAYKGMQELCKLIKDTHHQGDYCQTYDVPSVILYSGIYGLFVIGYYNLIGASFNGVTLGCVFCMSSIAMNGSHLRNVIPIMIGYIIGITGLYIVQSLVGIETSILLHTQSVIVGICFASGMSPLVGKYGWIAGVVAGILHLIVVLHIPVIHGFYCLYNGGFTACLVSAMMVPVLERYQSIKID